MYKYLLFIFVLFSACNVDPVNQSDRELARVYNDYLYESDIKDLITPGLSVNDSILLVKNYIDTWVMNKLLLAKAEQNLTPVEKDFKKQLESYKNSLLIYQYETRLINQSGELKIQQQEIEKYFNEYVDNFMLTNDIVKAVWAKMPEDFENIETLTELIKSEKGDDLELLSEMFEDNADIYLLEENWMSWQEFSEMVPVEIQNPAYFLSRNDYLTVPSEQGAYYVKFLDYKVVGDTAPVDYEKNKIEQILVNQKKRKFLEELHYQLLDDAMSDNDCEIY